MLTEEQRKQLAERVHKERQEQGLPPRVSDPATLRRLAALLASGGR